MTTLEAVLEGAGVVQWHGAHDVDVTSVVCDSRHVEPGSVFFALPGTDDDGRRFVDDADIGFISTAGGALIRFISGQPLPLLDAMERAAARNV